MNNNTISYIYSILIYIIPLLLLTGSFLPDLAISLLALSFIFIIYKKKMYHYFNNRFFYFFLYFSLFLCICSIFSENIVNSLETSFVYIRFSIFALVVWYVIENNKNFLKFFTYVFISIFILALIDGYIQFFLDRNIFGLINSWDSSTRLTLTFNDSLILGGYLARFLPFLIGLIILNVANNKLMIFLTCSLLILTDILIYLSGERTAMALLVISTVMIIILLSRFNLIRLITFILSIIIIILFTIFDTEVRNRNINKTLDQIGINNIDEENKQIYIFSQGHQSYYLTSIDLFFKNPITGIGPNNFKEKCKDYIIEKEEYACSTHPHNSFIQILAETGILGFIIILCLLLLICKIFISQIYYKIRKKKLPYNDYQICIFISLFLSLFPLLPSQDVFNGWINIIYFFPVGFLLHSIHMKD